MYWGRKKNIIRLTEEKEWEKNKIGMEGRGKWEEEIGVGQKRSVKEGERREEKKSDR